MNLPSPIAAIQRWPYRKKQNVLRAMTFYIVLIVLAATFEGHLPLVATVVSIFVCNLVMMIAFAWRLDKQPGLLRRAGYQNTCVEARNQLIRMGEQSVPVLMEILLSAPNSEQLRGWSAQLARQQATAVLEELKPVHAVPALTKVLHDDDHDVRVGVIRALAAIGSDEAITALLPELLDRNVEGHVVATLRQTGRGDVLETFCRLFEGNGAARDLMSARHRNGMIGASLLALKGKGPSSTTLSRVRNSVIQENAALALGEMGAVEALPALRAKVAAHSRTPSSLQSACLKAIAQLEQLVGLPREAQPVETMRETIPRVADGPQPTTESLPRAR